jgi:hypothetical protein
MVVRVWVIVPVRMVVGVRVAVGVTVIVRVAVDVRVVARSIRTGLGLERRLDALDACAEASHHRLEHVVARDADAVRQQLARDVPVADVPRQAQEEVRWSKNVRDRLRAGDNAYHAAIVEQQSVAITQRVRLGQIEQEVESFDRAHREAAAVAAIVRQRDRAAFALAIPGPRRQHGLRASHGHRHTASPPSKQEVALRHR